MHLRWIYILLMVMAGINSINGQCSLKVTGQVQDRHDGASLEFASVYIPELKKDYTTDITGQFAIEGLCAGRYHFDVFHIGCESQSFFIEISSDTVLVFQMEHHLELLSEVLITEHKHDRNLSQASYALSGSELQRLKSQSLAAIVSGIPGVDMIQSGGNAAKPIIQGLTGNRIAMVSDGVILESQQWGIDHAPEINGSHAEKISVIKSSAPVLYGTSAMGGVILVDNFKQVEDPHLHGIVNSSYNTNGRAFGGSAKLMGKMLGWTYNTQAMFRKNGDQHTPDYFLNNTGSQEVGGGLAIGKISDRQSLRIRADYMFQNLGILRGAHIGNTTDLENALYRSVPFFTEEQFSYTIEAPRQEIGHLTTAVNYSRNISAHQNLNFSYNLQQNRRMEFDVRRGGRSDKPIIDLRLLSQTANLTWDYEGKSINTKIGADFRYQDNDNLPGTGALPLIPDYMSWKPSLFFLQAADLSDHFHAEYGLRYEYTGYSIFKIVNNAIEASEKKFNGGAINLGFVYYNDLTSIKVDASYIARAPQVNEMYNSGLHQGIAALEFGNPSLGLEQSVKITADASQQLGKAGKINLTLYGQKVKDFIYLAPAAEPALTVRGAFLVYNYTNNDALISGLDMLHVVNLLSDLDWTNKLSYIRAINTDENKELVLTPPFRASSAVNYDVALGGVKSNSLEFFVQWKYTGRQNEVADGDDFLAAPEAYHLADGGIIFHSSLLRLPMDLELSCSNIFNKTYRDYMNRLRYFADDTGRNLHLNLQIKF